MSPYREGGAGVDEDRDGPAERHRDGQHARGREAAARRIACGRARTPVEVKLVQHSKKCV